MKLPTVAVGTIVAAIEAGAMTRSEIQFRVFGELPKGSTCRLPGHLYGPATATTWEEDAAREAAVERGLRAAKKLGLIRFYWPTKTWVQVAQKKPLTPAQRFILRERNLHRDSPETRRRIARRNEKKEKKR